MNKPGIILCVLALGAGGIFAQEKAEEKLSPFEVGVKKTKAPENAVLANYSANVLFTTTFGKATKRMTDREMPESTPAAGTNETGEDDSGFDFAALEEPTNSTDIKRIETAYAPRIHFKKTVKSDNSVEEEWFVNGFYITKNEDADTAFIHEPGAMGGRRMPKEGVIPDMDWVNAQSFIGTGKYKGKDVYIFEDWSRIEIVSTSAPQVDINDETVDFHERMETKNVETKRVIDKSRSRPNARVYVDPATMLPIAKETAYVTEFYEFASIPGGLTTPPDVRAQYHGFINRSTDLTQKYGLPQ